MRRPDPTGGRPGAVVLGSDYKALAAIRSLARLGVPCTVVDNQPRSAWYSRHVRSRHRWRGQMAGPQFTTFLSQLADAEALQGWLLFPMQDDAVEAVAHGHPQLAAIYRIVTPPWSKLRTVHDKRLLNAMADAVGVPHPKTWYPDSEAELASMDIMFPAIVKPTMSIGMQHLIGRKALPAPDREGLLAQYRLAVEAVPPPGLMVQELIPGRGDHQFSVASFCIEGSVVAAMTARRSRQYPYDFGLSSSFVEAVDVPGLIEIAGGLLQQAGLSGMLEVEFKLDPRDGVFKLLDVNVRPWSWHGLCTASGLDFSAMQYHWAMGEPLANGLPRYGHKWMRLVTDVPAAVQELRAGTLNLRAYATSVRGPLVFSVLDFHDPLPVLGDLVSVASRAARKRMRNSRRWHTPVAEQSPSPSSYC